MGLPMEYFDDEKKDDAQASDGEAKDDAQTEAGQTDQYWTTEGQLPYSKKLKQHFSDFCRCHSS